MLKLAPHRSSGCVRVLSRSVNGGLQGPPQSLFRTHLPRKVCGVRNASFAASAGRIMAKTRRAASFMGYSAFVIGGLGLTGVAAWYFAQEMLLPSSDIQVFQNAFSLIEKDEKSREILGKKLKAHGEKVNNRWNHTRPIASRRGVDRAGREHIIMQFHVDGELNSGLVKLELIDGKGSRAFRYLLLDVPGHPTHYIINETPKKDRRTGWFGIKWGPKRQNDE